MIKACVASLKNHIQMLPHNVNVNDYGFESHFSTITINELSNTVITEM